MSSGFDWWYRFAGTNSKLIGTLVGVELAVPVRKRRSTPAATPLDPMDLPGPPELPIIEHPYGVKDVLCRFVRHESVGNAKCSLRGTFRSRRL
jgi:hypothetical protein